MKKLFVCILSLFLLINPSYAGSKSYSGGSSSGRSYSPPSSSKPSSSAGRSYSPPSSSKPLSSSVSKPSSSGKSYSGGSAKAAPPKSPPPSSNSKQPPASKSWSSNVTNKVAKEQSKSNYVKSNPVPPKTYKTPTGETKSVPSQNVQTTKKYVTYERHVTYENRSNNFYHGYGYHPYNDFFSPFLMGYIISDAINSHDRALWVYNHRSELDDARYRDLLQKDAELKQRIEELERQGSRPDNSYVLPGMQNDPDLQYSKEYLDSVYEENSSFSWGLVIGVFGAIITLLLVYFLFIKEFKK